MERVKELCKVLNGGLHTTVQDLGRKGYYAEGIPASGAFDTVAFRLANRIVGNEPNAAGLEVLWGGLKLEFLAPAQIAVTGGDLGAELDGTPLPLWRKITVQAGQKLAFTGRKTGFRAYVSFVGGLDVPEFLGSRSTYLILGKGGVEGRKLKPGDILHAFSTEAAAGHTAIPVCNPDPELIRSLYPQPWKLRVVYGLQYDFFTEESIRDFVSVTWAVTNKMDRTGLRFSGPALKFRDRTGKALGGVDPSNIPTEGNPLGCIQCPAGPELIVLGPDGPCEGGYAKMATVIKADFYLLAQMAEGDEVKFVPVPLDEAYEALYRQESLLAK